jgi:hypothetical protein
MALNIGSFCPEIFFGRCMKMEQSMVQILLFNARAALFVIVIDDGLS